MLAVRTIMIKLITDIGIIKNVFITPQPPPITIIAMNTSNDNSFDDYNYSNDNFDGRPDYPNNYFSNINGHSNYKSNNDHIIGGDNDIHANDDNGGRIFS